METNSLYHHGILGQKWGKRNGPPYPLHGGGFGSGVKGKGNSAARVLGGAASSVKSRARKAVYGNKRTNTIPRRKTPLSDEDRQRVIRSGNPAEVKAYKHELTRKEMDEAVQRVNWEKTLDSVQYSPSTEFLENLKVYKDAISTVAISIALYNSFKRLGK